jgi:triosephosphate isomerase
LGVIASIVDVREMCVTIRTIIAGNLEPDNTAGIRISYRGSVKDARRELVAAPPDVDGFLV